MNAEELEYVLNAVLRKSECSPRPLHPVRAPGSWEATRDSLGLSSPGPAPPDPHLLLRADMGQTLKSFHCLFPDYRRDAGLCQQTLQSSEEFNDTDKITHNLTTHHGYQHVCVCLCVFTSCM